MSKQRKAVALISGGLDSMLAAKTVMAQGIHVEGINFYTGFCVEGHTHAIRNKDKANPKRNNALWVAEQLGIKLHIVDVIEEYKKVLINPKHGYGAHLNPCLDCKIFMVNRAKQWLAENDFDFIITGEVIGQRPMSQRKSTMPIIAKQSGAEDLLLRPLCAKNLPATLPEREGWINKAEVIKASGKKNEGLQFDELKLELKYVGKNGAITSIKRISKCGLRVYAGKLELPRVLNNLGIAIISTPSGLMTNKEAKKKGLGGEVICEIY